MVQLVKSAKDIEIFGAQLWHRHGEHQDFKGRGDLAKCAILGPAIAVFRIMQESYS